jgi:hypothetical protein
MPCGQVFHDKGGHSDLPVTPALLVGGLDFPSPSVSFSPSAFHMLAGLTSRADFFGCISAERLLCLMKTAGANCLC